MSLVRIGEVAIGSIQRMPAANVQGYEYRALRVGPPGDDLIYVGTADTQLAAMNLIARSLIAQSIEPPGVLSPSQRAKLADLQAQLDAMGLGELARAVNAALKE